MARKPRKVHVEYLKAEIREKFGPLSHVSKAMGMSDNAVSNILSSPAYSIPGERKLAKLMGWDVREVWPDRYHDDGTPVPRVADRQPTCVIPADLRQNGVAA
ncbi:helix-turn-helix domain-containing protein [Acetobacter suratthaniensis]|uniref:Helix-turn-helix domain-containing protein n=2 Tax=Acetobacter suratthaniensis TaxID=1502841 RepID=A0ABS3LMR2_9PROT|nr:helix-turn-helix domain-containing protein [Acetobacter suratthaniensis]MBO1328656.1 helix-turn-helix domain-containing protein [Acetobacter suratthaniensis]